MSLRRWIAAAALLAGAGAAAFAVWLWIQRSREPVLEQEWTAVAFVLAGDGRGDPRRFLGERPLLGSVRCRGRPGWNGVRRGRRRVAETRRIHRTASCVHVCDGINTPSGLAIDANGVLYVADTGNNAIRRVDSDGTVSTVAEGFNGPIGDAVDAAGRLIVAHTYNDRIRAIERDGSVVTITQEYFHTPCGVAADAAGNIYVAETGAGAIRMISAAGIVSNVEPMPFDGLFRPIAIAAGLAAFSVSDERGHIVEIRPGRCGPDVSRIAAWIQGRCRCADAWPRRYGVRVTPG
jgi:hypothetical protein